VSRPAAPDCTRAGLFSHMGVSLCGRHLWWREGGRLWWAPEWVKRTIVTAWNRVSCALLGHDRLYMHAADGFPAVGPLCTACCKRLP